jgi:Ca2+:H+ antiporter
MKRLGWLTLIVPIAIAVGHFLGSFPLLIFAVGGGAIAVLSEWMRRSTEQLAIRAGPSIGGLINISFGSVAELILMTFVIVNGHPDVVRGQITGSIIGTSLLGLGLACLVGGWGRKRQTLLKRRAGLLTSLFFIVVFALVLPAVFHQAELRRGVAVAQRRIVEQQFSLGAAAVLLLLYGGNLIFTLVTHRDVFRSASPEPKLASWTLRKSLAVLGVATVAVALCADLVANALQGAAATLHIPLLFLGVVPLALIGTAADLFAAIAFARQDKMDLVMTISIGSAIQVGLVLAPLLVLISWTMGKPMTLVFPSLLDLFAIGGAAFIVNAISTDGEMDWFEGLLLVGAYSLLALAFFFSSLG